MPLQQMPNGAYVDIDDGTPSDVVQRIKSQYAAKPAARAISPRATPLSARQQEDRADSAGYGKVIENNLKTNLLPGVAGLAVSSPDANRAGIAFGHEATLHLDDVIGPATDAATRGVVRAVKKRDIGEIGRLYTNDRTGAREYREKLNQDHPWESGVGGTAGLLVNPIGKRALAERVAEKLSTGIGSSLVGEGVRSAFGASRAGKAAAVVGNAAKTGVGNAAITGFEQAGITGLADTGNVKDAANKGLEGAVLGGTVGGIAHALGGVGRALSDRAPGQASRVAYEKVADMLSRARRPGGKPFTPEAAEREMRVAAASGHDPSLMDLSPEMQASGAAVSRKANLPSAAGLVQAAEERIGGAADRFDAKMREIFNPSTGTDAVKRSGDITAARKAQGAEDYRAGGFMDRAVKKTKELREFLENPTPVLADAFKEARTIAANDRRPFAGSGIPTMRSFDDIKRAFDGKIGEALKRGNENDARMFSQELRALKGHLAKANPEYAGILARQRDAFQRLESVDLGKTFLTRMRKEPRELLAEMKSGNTNPDELRTGMADALLAMRNTSDNPVQTLRRYMRAPAQRAVLEHAFGGTKILNRFDRFMRRELRGTRTDEAITRAKATQSYEPSDAGAARQLAERLIHAPTPGGIAGAISGTARTLDELKRGIGPAAQEKLGQILGGRGEGLAARTKAAKDFAAARKLKAQRRANAAAKLGASTASSGRE